MELDLAGRVVLVTGASRGIGLAVARALVAEGAKVAICSRDAAAIGAAAALLGDAATGFAADVRDDAAVAAFVGHAAATFGRLDAVVNNAGRFGGGPVLELTDEALHEGLDTKVAAALRVVRHALAHLRASDRAAVVNVSGITAEMVIPGAGVTAMGNAGLLTLTAYLAHELAADGVRVNGIVPGYTLTGVWRDRARALADEEGLALEQADRTWRSSRVRARPTIGEDAVVDPELRVHGVEGLRLADASVMPAVTTGNTNAPSMMIGARPAAMMLAA